LARDAHLGGGDSAVGDPTFWFLDLMGFTLNFLSLLR
jgi:hypothetical protein